MARGVPLWFTVGGLAAVLLLSFGHGYRVGFETAEARHQAAREAVERRLMREADRLSERVAELDRAQEALRARAEEAEHAARLDLDVCRVPADVSLQRLRRRWAAD